MSLTHLRNHLPELNGAALDFIFDHVYDIVEMPGKIRLQESSKASNLLEILKALQRFNYHHRPDDTRKLFSLMSRHFNFERNSEGTTLWLSLLLAIKELYGVTNRSLNLLIQSSHVR